MSFARHTHSPTFNPLVVIEKNVVFSPIPRPGRPSVSSGVSKYRLHEMLVGDAFRLDERYFKTTADRGKLRSVASLYGKKNNKKFAIRLIVDPLNPKKAAYYCKRIA